MKAVSEQAAKAAHVSNYFATEPQIKLAAKLVKLAGAPEVPASTSAIPARKVTRRR